MNRKPKMTPFTKKDFDRQFPDDAACLEWLKNRLYPEGVKGGVKVDHSSGAKLDQQD